MCMLPIYYKLLVTVNQQTVFTLGNTVFTLGNTFKYFNMYLCTCVNE